ELAAMVAPAQPVTEAELREALHGKRLNQVVPAVEPVSEWLKAAEEMRQALTTPQEHSNEGVLYLMQSAQGHSLQLGLAGIRLSVSRGQSWTLRWHVSSLLDVLWLQAAQSLASA